MSRTLRVQASGALPWGKTDRRSVALKRLIIMLNPVGVGEDFLDATVAGGKPQETAVSAAYCAFDFKIHFSLLKVFALH